MFFFWPVASAALLAASWHRTIFSLRLEPKVAAVIAALQCGVSSQVTLLLPVDDLCPQGHSAGYLHLSPPVSTVSEDTMWYCACACAVLSRRQRSCDVPGGRWIAVIHKRAPVCSAAALSSDFRHRSCPSAAAWLLPQAKLLSPRSESLTYQTCLLCSLRGVVEWRMGLNPFVEGSLVLKFKTSE